MKNIIVGVTGASGVIYAQRLLEFLISKDVKIHLIISSNAETVIEEELFTTPQALAEMDKNKIISYSPSDLAAAPASGSSRMDAMTIIPCSMGTMGAINAGLASNLIHRAASVCLKERRPLVLVPREMPVSTIHLQCMLELSRLGVAIVPAMPAFYHHPKSVNDLVDFVVTRVLDQLGIESDLIPRWE